MPAELQSFLTGQAPGFGVGCDDVVYLGHRRPGHPFQYALNNSRDAWKRQPAFEERGNGDFIGRIQGARQWAAFTQRGLGQTEARKLACGDVRKIKLA
jgi:hypothetical protein